MFKSVHVRDVLDWLSSSLFQDMLVSCRINLQCILHSLQSIPASLRPNSFVLALEPSLSVFAFFSLHFFLSWCRTPSFSCPYCKDMFLSLSMEMLSCPTFVSRVFPTLLKSAMTGEERNYHKKCHGRLRRFPVPDRSASWLLWFWSLKEDSLTSRM